MDNNVQKPFDLMVEDFRNEMVNLINSNQNLPLSVIVLVMNEVFERVNGQYSQYLNKIKADYQDKLNTLTTQKVDESVKVDETIDKDKSK